MGYGQSVRSQIDSINRNSATLMKLRLNSERPYRPMTPAGTMTRRLRMRRPFTFCLILATSLSR